MINILSTREFASISLFTLVFMLALCKNQTLRHNTKKLIKQLLQPELFLLMDLLLIYELLIILLISRFTFWQNRYYKEFSFWILFGCYPALFNISHKNIKEFKKMIMTQFLFSSFVEFLSGLITFSLIRNIFYV